MPEAFNLVPEAPLSERWSWLTDVITSRDRTESRFSLRELPRRTFDLDVEALDQEHRVEQLLLLARLTLAPVVMPHFHLSTGLSAAAPQGSTRLYFDPRLADVREGGYLVLWDEDEMIEPFVTLATALYTDGADVFDPTPRDLPPGYAVSGGTYGAVQDAAKLSTYVVSSTLTARVESLSEEAVQRPGASASLTEFDGLPVLERVPLAGADEELSARRTVVDNETGARYLRNVDPSATVSGERRFQVKRLSDPADWDYWMLFLDTVRGSWRSFLLASAMDDLAPASPLAQGATSMSVPAGWAGQHGDDAFSRFQVHYADGSVSRHAVTDSSDEGDGTATVTFSPALPSDPKVETHVKVSTLVRCVMGDNLGFEHWPDRSILSLEIRTTSQG